MPDMMPINREQFLKQMKSQFPDGYANISEAEQGLLHCEMAAFRIWVENKLEKGYEWNCQKAFEFIAQCLTKADPQLQNAIEVSFIEDLALWGNYPEFQKVIKERAPKIINKKLNQ